MGILIFDNRVGVENLRGVVKSLKKSPDQKCGFDLAKNVGTDIELKKFSLILTKI